MSDASVTRLSAEEARKGFDRLLDRVGKRGERVVVSRGGKDVAALIPVQELPLIDEETRRRFLKKMAAIQARSDLNEEQALELAYSELRALRAAS